MSARTSLVPGVAAVLLVALAAGCTGGRPAPAATPPPAMPPISPSAEASPPDERRADPDLVTMRGVRSIEIGALRSELVSAGLVNEEGGCGPAFIDLPYGSPVFDADRLVLIWAHAPLRTPERVMVGSTLAEAKAAYPQGIDLTRPPGATEYPGLLVAGDTDRAYLFLHDGETVQKLIVGFEVQARRLFDTGFGSC